MKAVLEIINGKKECEGCGHFLELREFFPSKTYYSRKCRKCTRECLLRKTGEKLCPKCNEIKPYSEFRPNKECHDKYCKLCRAEIQRWKYHNDAEYRERWKQVTAKYQKKNQEKRTEYFQEWKKRNPEKIKSIREAYRGKHKINNLKYVQKNKDWIYPQRQQHEKKRRASVDDSYIKYIFRNEGLRNPPPQLIKLRKLQILSKRILKLKQNEPHPTTRPNVASATRLA